MVNKENTFHSDSAQNRGTPKCTLGIQDWVVTTQDSRIWEMTVLNTPGALAAWQVYYLMSNM